MRTRRPVGSGCGPPDPSRPRTPWRCKGSHARLRRDPGQGRGPDRRRAWSAAIRGPTAPAGGSGLDRRAPGRRRRLVGRRPARAARAAGARVHRIPRIVGKGRAMAEGALVATGDLVVFLDADVPRHRPRLDPPAAGAAPRSTSGSSSSRASTSGPSTASPDRGRPGDRARRAAVLSLLFPELAGRPPAARRGDRGAARDAPRPADRAATTAWRSACSSTSRASSGAGSIAQVDLGRRTHRNRPLAELSAMARDVLRVALAARRACRPR